MEYDPARIFKALSNESRLEILKSLYQEGISGTLEGQELCAESCSCVGDIVERFRLAPSTISHHIKELAMAGLVRVERNGQFIRIFPNPEALKAISTFSDSLVRQVSNDFDIPKQKETGGEGNGVEKGRDPQRGQ
jgi:ArsR family transcriptional regulator